MAIFILYLIFASILGALAKSKNRNVLAWGLIGGLFFIFSMLILILLPALCPICNQSLSNKDRKCKSCSKCGYNKNSAETVEVYEKFKLRPNHNNEYNSSCSTDINNDKLAEDNLFKAVVVEDNEKGKRNNVKIPITALFLLVVIFLIVLLVFKSGTDNEKIDPKKAAEMIYKALDEISEKDITKELIGKVDNASMKFTSKVDGFAITFPSTPRRLVVDNYSNSKVVNYQSLSNDELVQYNVFLNYFTDKKILSNESQKAFLENYLVGCLLIVENSSIIENRLGTFNKFNSTFYKYSCYQEGIEIIHEGVVFLVDGDSISLTCVYPKSISPVFNLNDFKTSFELVSLEPILQKESWYERSLNIKMTPPIDMFLNKSSKASTVVSFANKGGHSLGVFDIKSEFPSFKMTGIRNEFPSADFEPDGFIINAIYNNQLGMTFIQMLKFIEYNNRIYMLQSYSPETSFIKYKETFKASMNTFSSIQ